MGVDVVEGTWTQIPMRRFDLKYETPPSIFDVLLNTNEVKDLGG